MILTDYVPTYCGTNCDKLLNFIKNSIYIYERIIVLCINLMILTSYALTYRGNNCNKFLNFIVYSIKGFLRTFRVLVCLIHNALLFLL
jgi:hypothetical protein